MSGYALLFSFLVILGIVLTSLILGLLLDKQKKQAPHFLLKLFFSIIWITLVHYFGIWHEVKPLIGFTDFLTSGLGYLLGPIVYFYSMMLYESVDLWDKKVLLHAVPYLLFMGIVAVPEFLFCTGGFPCQLEHIAFYHRYFDCLYLIEMSWFLVYTVLAYRLLIKRQEVKAPFSIHGSEKAAVWGKQMLYVSAFFLLVEITCSCLYPIFTGIDNGNIELFSTWAIVFAVIYLGYSGIYQSEQLVPSFLLEKIAVNNQPYLHFQAAASVTAFKLQSTIVRPAKVAITFSEQECQAMQGRLSVAFEQDLLYRNPNLSLTDLAEAVGTTDKKLSTFLNQEMNNSFYTLVNTYRVAAFKECIRQKENEQLTILAIAQDCGFKSKTTFNRIFKKQTGMTPSAFVRANQRVRPT